MATATMKVVATAARVCDVCEAAARGGESDKLGFIPEVGADLILLGVPAWTRAR